MKGALLTFVCISLVLTPVPAEVVPQAPQWPILWSASWTEILDHLGTEITTTGYGFYDYINQHLLWSRASGFSDHICVLSLQMHTDTECQHIIADGNHYLYAPDDRQQCCMCCDASHGCGMPGPTYFVNSTLLEEDKDAYYWNITSGATYIESTDVHPVNRSWIGLISEHNNYTKIFNWTTNVDSNSFSVPSNCIGADICLAGACNHMRKQSIPIPDHPNRPPRQRRVHPGVPFLVNFPF